jgi:hypothetical protein
MTEPRECWTVPLDVCEADARLAAQGGASVYAWICMECRHEWGTSSVRVYAEPAWCPRCASSPSAPAPIPAPSVPATARPMAPASSPHEGSGATPEEEILLAMEEAPTADLQYLASRVCGLQPTSWMARVASAELARRKAKGQRPSAAHVPR